MPIRLIAIDLDGTLLNSRNEISPKNLEAIAAAMERGIEVVIVTGRRFHSARPFVEQIPGNVIVISSNGARIGTISGEIYYRNFLARQVAQKVICEAEAFTGYAVAFFDVPGRGQVLMHTEAAPEGPVSWYLRSCRDCLFQTPDLAAAITTDPIQVMFGGPPERIEPIEAALRSSPVASLCHLSWTKYLTRNLSLLDVMNHSCSKGSALAYWAAERGIQPEAVMALGDNLNDLEMLQYAGTPVLMANHNLSEIPDGWQVTLLNDKDGVAEAIRCYALAQ